MKKYIYKISDTTPSWQKYENKKGNGLKSIKAIGKKNRNDLFNWANYETDGTISYPQESFYDTKFIKELNSLKGSWRVDFINYQYRHTYDKHLFLERMDSFLARIETPFNEVLTPEAKEFLLSWYNAEIDKLPLNSKAEKPITHPTLSEYFKKDCFAKAIDVIKKLELINGRAKEFNKSKGSKKDILETLYKVFTTKDILKPMIAPTSFKTLLCEYYGINKPAGGTLTKGAYNKNLSVDIESELNKK